MNFQEALVVVQKVQADFSISGLLETLEFMSDSGNHEELTGQELCAFRVVFNEMGKLFATA